MNYRTFFAFVTAFEIHFFDNLVDESGPSLSATRHFTPRYTFFTSPLPMTCFPEILKVTDYLSTTSVTSRHPDGKLLLQPSFPVLRPYQQHMFASRYQVIVVRGFRTQNVRRSFVAIDPSIVHPQFHR